MATKAQIEANPASALLSSGPVTKEGPATSSHNTVENGLSGQTSNLERPSPEGLRPCPLSSRPKGRRNPAPDDGYVKLCKRCRAVMADRRRTYCSVACTRLALDENSKFIVPPSISPRASFVRNPYRRR